MYCGYRPRRSESGLLWVAERIPPPSFWLPPAALEPEIAPPRGFLASEIIWAIIARSPFAITLGPIHVAAEQYDRLLYGDQEARTTSIFDRSDEVRSRPILGIAKEDAAAGDELEVDLNVIGSMGDTLQEILDLPETPA